MSRSALSMLLAAVWVTACDSNVVGQAGDGGADSGTTPPDQTYPEGPYGKTVGEILRNMSFKGYANLSPADGIVSKDTAFEDFALGDARELSEYRYALINAAAEWCAPCRDEAQALPAKFTAWAPKGGYVIGILTQDDSFNPAQQGNVDAWIRQYDTNYTMLSDPHTEIDNEIAPVSMPLNIMVDLETMKIERIATGDDPEFFNFFERRLNQ